MGQFKDWATARFYRSLDLGWLSIETRISTAVELFKRMKFNITKEVTHVGHELPPSHMQALGIVSTQLEQAIKNKEKA